MIDAAHKADLGISEMGFGRTKIFSGRIACIGEAMAELSLGQNATQAVNLGFAGDTLNTAIYLKRLLGSEADVNFVSALGFDPLSTRMLDFIAAENIRTEDVSLSTDRLIGLYAIATDAAGERSFSYWRSESAARQLFQSPDGFDVLQKYDVLCLSAITLAILPDAIRTELLAKLNALRSEKNTVIVFDSNYRPKLWESTEIAQQRVAEAWKITDIALPSVDDEMALFGDVDEKAVITRLKSYGVSRGALKRGDQGPLSLSSGESLAASDFSHVEVVDTTAAGDSFNAGYLAATLSEASEREALLAGHKCAMRVIGHAGAIIPQACW